MDSAIVAFSSKRFESIPSDIKNKIAIEILLNYYEDTKIELRIKLGKHASLGDMTGVLCNARNGVKRNKAMLLSEIRSTPNFNTTERTELLSRLESKIVSLDAELALNLDEVNHMLAEITRITRVVMETGRKIIDMSNAEGVSDSVINKIERINIRDLSECL